MKNLTSLIMNIEGLHPKMKKHIMDGMVTLMLWMFCFTLYVIFLDNVVGAFRSDNDVLVVAMFGFAVFLTNVMIVLTKVTYRATVLMVKTSRKAIQVLNNK
jgi:uncharacterized membrane protein (GlpM family)